MSERETKTIITPDAKAEVVIHSYMTGSEMMDLEESTITAGVRSVSQAGGVDMDAAKAYKNRLRKLFDIMVVSVAGETDPEKKWTAVRDLKSGDFAFVMKEIDDASQGLTEAEGKD